MKKIILLIAFLVCNIIIAQRSSNYNNVQKIILQGLVVDKETQQPLEYATISLKTERLPDRLYIYYF